MTNNDMNNIMKSVGLEMELNKVEKRMEIEMMSNDVYMEFIDKKYEDKLRDLELVENIRRRMTTLCVLITSLKDIEHQAIVIKDMELYWKCENKIARMMNQMELLKK